MFEGDAIITGDVALMLPCRCFVAVDWTRRNEPRMGHHHLLEKDWITMIVRVDDPLDLRLVVIQRLDRDPRPLVVLLLETTLDPARRHLDEVDILLLHPLVADDTRTRDHLPLVDRTIELDLGLQWSRG